MYDFTQHTKDKNCRQQQPVDATDQKTSRNKQNTYPRQTCKDNGGRGKKNINGIARHGKHYL